MKKLVKYSLLALAITVMGIAGILVFLETTDKLPYKNYTDFSTASGYVYCEVSYNDSTYLLVEPNTSLYASLNSYVFEQSLNPITYSLRLFLSNLLNQPIEVNHDFYSLYTNNFTDLSAAQNLKKEEVMTEISNLDMLPESTSKPQNQLIYFLLKNNIKNCLNECESGRVVLADIKK